MNASRSSVMCEQMVIKKMNRIRTSFCRDLFKVDFETNVVFGFSLAFHERTIFAFQDVICTVLNKLCPATDMHGKQECALALRC